MSKSTRYVGLGTVLMFLLVIVFVRGCIKQTEAVARPQNYQSVLLDAPSTEVEAELPTATIAANGPKTWRFIGFTDKADVYLVNGVPLKYRWGQFEAPDGTVKDGRCSSPYTLDPLVGEQYLFDANTQIFRPAPYADGTEKLLQFFWSREKVQESGM